MLRYAARAMCMARAATLCLLLGALAFAPAAARAQSEGDVDLAGRVYDQAAQAQKDGDYARAAALFARADAIVPNPVALEAALHAAMLADDPVLGMNLAERAAGRSPRGPLARLVEAARRKLGGRAGRVRVTCPSACVATIDGGRLGVGAPEWVTTGRHVVEIDTGPRVERQVVHVEPGRTVAVAPRVPVSEQPSPEGDPRSHPPEQAFERPEQQPQAAREGGDGLAPAWFWVGLSATVLAGGATIASGVDTMAKHDAFLDAPGDAAADEGRAAEARTNVLLGVTCVLAVATAVVGIAAVEWTPPAARKPAAPAAYMGEGGLRFRF